MCVSYRLDRGGGAVEVGNKRVTCFMYFCDFLLFRDVLNDDALNCITQPWVLPQLKHVTRQAMYMWLRPKLNQMLNNCPAMMLVNVHAFSPHMQDASCIYAAYYEILV